VLNTRGRCDFLWVPFPSALYRLDGPFLQFGGVYFKILLGSMLHVVSSWNRRVFTKAFLWYFAYYIGLEINLIQIQILQLDN
jgi:hypothetical protein